MVTAEPEYREGNRSRAASRILKEMKGWGSWAHRGTKFWLKGKTPLPSQAELLGNYHPMDAGRGLSVRQRQCPSRHLGNLLI